MSQSLWIIVLQSSSDGFSTAKSHYTIAKLKQDKKFAALPQELQDAAALREEHPEANLEELRHLANPPISKSGLNHRLRKLIELSEE